MSRSSAPPTRRSLGRPTAAAAILLAAAALPAGGTAALLAARVHDAPAPATTTAAPDSVPLYDGLGDHRRPVATRSEAAQAYFDQGLRLQYAFNHEEAIRSYEEALRHDPGCAMCRWGLALASGPNINAPMSPEAGERARDAIAEARTLSRDGPEDERAWIEALAARYADDPSAPRPSLDSAYARAMEALAEAHPDDPDALTLYAASLMNLSPWNYWTGDFGDRRPRPDTPRILASLERALEIAPEHPGACHYYIHAVEAGHPEKAVPCAERLAELMPAAGHIVHMPGHVYIRVGRYADAVRTNEHAVHADETYIADRRPGGLYPAAYYPHNYHFMAFAATMAGMGDRAMGAARRVAPKVPVEVAREIPWIQNIVVLPQLTAVTFGRWEEVLDAPMPPSDLDNATALAHYARGVAFAATGRPDEAEAEAEALRRVAGRTGAGDAEPSDPTVVVAIAEHALAGEVALRDGRPADAVAHFEAAAELEDGMLYEEPPLWHHPVRHALGRALLEAGRPDEAERRYREDLAKYPANGWSLHGLAAALEAQGRDDEAREARAAFARAWGDADVELTASRL
jgi:tetratricopeptide (TPR) repeat protein